MPNNNDDAYSLVRMRSPHLAVFVFVCVELILVVVISFYCFKSSFTETSIDGLITQHAAGVWVNVNLKGIKIEGKINET